MALTYLRCCNRLVETLIIHGNNKNGSIKSRMKISPLCVNIKKMQMKQSVQRKVETKLCCITD